MAAKKKAGTSTGGDATAAKKANKTEKKVDSPAISTTPGVSAQDAPKGKRLPSPTGATVEVPTEAPQKVSLTGSPSYMPPGHTTVTPGIPELGTPAASPKGTPKPAGGGDTSLRTGTGTPAASDEPTMDLSASLPPGARPTSSTAAGPEVALRFGPGDGVEHGAIKPGATLKVSYLREGPRHEPDAARIELGYRFDELPVGMAVIADGQRSRDGKLARREAVLRVPPEAQRELQVWFRIETVDGRTHWDSQFGHNYRFKLSR